MHRTLLLVVIAGFVFAPPLAAETPAAAIETIRPLLQTLCSDCHNQQTAEGHLDLSKIITDLNGQLAFAAWAKIYDRLRDREMPPRDAKQPTDEQRAALLTALNANLHAADTTRQRREGRALARRLNRDEYQNTLRDLLGVTIDYRPLLPADGTASGFDKVGSALSISPEHLETYLAAADAALSEIIVTGDRPPLVKRQFLQRYNRYFSLPSYERRWQHLFYDAPDAFVRYTSLNDHISGFRAQEPGIYRLAIRARAYDSDQPVRAKIRAGFPGENSGGQRWLVGYEDFPPEGKLFETIQRLDRGGTLRISPYGLGHRITERYGERQPPSPRGQPGLALEYVEVEGPLFDSWPPSGHQRLFGNIDFATATLSDAKTVLQRFLPRAFRRPVNESEVQHYVSIYEHATTDHDFLPAIRVALKAALCSPHFLFLHAPAGPLDDYALASRLSYFFWNSMPDDELIDTAAKKQLNTPDLLRQQVERMLTDPKAGAFTESFTGQWLDLRKINATTPDVRLYPDYDELLEYSLVRETRAFFEELLKNDLSVVNFIQSDFAMLNDRLAMLYGIPDVEGIALRKINLPENSIRGGVLAQGAILKVTANGTTTSPIVRGAWLMDRLLNQPPPAPPASVPAIEPDTRGVTTIREQLVRHRADAACASCHAKFDPAGSALEQFDVIGSFRDRYRAELGATDQRMQIFSYERRRTGFVGLAQVVDASGELADGREFDDFASFRRLLMTDRPQIARGITAKLLTYATGAPPQFADRATIDSIVEKSRSTDYGLRSIIHEIVQSPAFLQQ
ncbi:MAG TPA: DUF1592 domain-containing protein [Pirellulaceae bacterium]|jgi:hypothetical protein